MRSEIVQTTKTMKKHLLFAAVMLFATATVFAQSETTTVVTKDKVVTTQRSADGEETVTVVKKIFHNSSMVDPLPSLYYSYENMLTGTFGPEANVPLRSSSFEWGLYGTTHVLTSRNGVFGISTGLGISNAYNYLTHDMVLTQDENRQAYIEPLITYSSVEGHGPANNYSHRSFVRYWSLRLPVMFELQWRIDGTPMAIAAGAELEWRFGMRSFARYGGAKHTITDNLNSNPVGFNVLCSLIIDDTVIFFRSGLTDMFNIQDCGDIYQMSLGFGFNFD